MQHLQGNELIVVLDGVPRIEEEPESAAESEFETETESELESEPETEAETMADEYDRATVNDFATRNMRGTQSCIRMPEMQAHTFEIKPVMITMLQMHGLYHGLYNEDANKHLMYFLEVCDSFKQNGVPQDVLRLRLFPLSLQGKARDWFNNLPEGSITSWADLEAKFRARFFSDDKSVEARDEFLSFRQQPDEHLYAAWERYKMLMKQCPNHGVDKWVVIQIFCTRLNPQSKAMVDSMTNGGYRNVPVNEVFRLLDQLSANNTQGNDRRITPTLPNTKEDSSSQIATILSALNTRFDVLESQMQKGTSHGVHSVHATPIVCEQCNDVHMPDNCPLYMGTESVNYMGKFQPPQGNPYSQTYNRAWRAHPNFSWSQGNTLNPPHESTSGTKLVPPPGFQMPSRQVPVKEEESKMDKMLARILSEVESSRVENKATFSLHETAIKNLEVQVGQLATQVNAMARNSLPSDTIPNPKRGGKEECHAIYLRSGKVLPDVLNSSKPSPKKKDHVVVDIDDKEIGEENVKDEESKKRQQVKENLDNVVKSKPIALESMDEKKRKMPTSNVVIPPLPFPLRFKKKEEDTQFKKFVDMFKQLHINIPFAEALESMPKYAKFLKDVLSKKRRFSEYETVALTEECSAVIQRKLPPKLKDPGSFYIPCNIGTNFSGKALCDLGASVNLMPLAVFNQLGLGEPKPTTVTLLFADRSTSQPRGIIEDVLVKVDKFIFPVDFIVIDCEVDWNIPLIFGRPFLATARTLIDVEKGEITMRVEDEHVTFKMNKLMKSPNEAKQCFLVDKVEQEEFKKPIHNGLVDALSIQSQIEGQAVEDGISVLKATPINIGSRVLLESSSLKSSIKEAWSPDLKKLPSNFQHDYLRTKNLPLGIASPLAIQQEEHLLEILQACKRATEWANEVVKIQAWLSNEVSKGFQASGHRLKHNCDGEVNHQVFTLPIDDVT